jgi:2Fe-2S ferredoxin|tara:strand:+ start:46 stop:429 length:384 start_codon:yes stop_codon:yes gene_type:complete
MQKLFADAGKALLFEMAFIKLLPHFELCPDGAEFETNIDESICEAALREGIKIEHACEMSCACTTCHIIVRDGFNLLDEASETEEDLLDKAWGLEHESRLSCQTIPKEGTFTIELPKYTINQVSEDH